MLKNCFFAPFDMKNNEVSDMVENSKKYSLTEIVTQEFSASKNYQVDLNKPHLEEKYRKKIVMIKKQAIDYEGEKCTLILIQDVTSFHMVDREIKDNIGLI